MKTSENPSTWKIIYNKFIPVEEGLREALCTLANGYCGTRGAAPEVSVSKNHYPGTYIAGIYNKAGTHIAGRTILNEDLVNCPNWLGLTFRIGRGEWMSPYTGKILSYHQELDMRRGVLFRMMRIKDRNGRITLIETSRIVHIANPHRAAIKYSITPENYSGRIIIRTGIDGSVQNTGVSRYRQLNSKHLKVRSMATFGVQGLYLSAKTMQSDNVISTASRARIYSEGKEVKPTRRIVRKAKEAIRQDLEITVKKKQTYDIEKIVSLYTSRDTAVKRLKKAALESVKKSPRFADLIETHQDAWFLLWRKFDIQIDGDEFSQKVLRLHMFHLLQTVTVHNTNTDSSIPARGLHGEAYRGHIFWDELFVMPFFDFHLKAISRALLMYRYRRIHKARVYAKRNLYRGAMFPWQSGSSGEEETQLVHLNPLSGKWGPDTSRIQRHVSFAIAYNVWRYWERTGDFDFFCRYGAEMLISIAQFGASLTRYHSGDGRYHTEGLMGPDEFHEHFPGAPRAGFRDNAYTNVLIVWTLRKARQAFNILPKEHRAKIVKKIGLDRRELKRWDDITKKMNIIFDDNGIISQFDGYFDLKELDLNVYRKKYNNIERMDRILKAEGKSPNDYKIAKQADVLMMFYLLTLSEVKEIFTRLGYPMDKKILQKNYDYYVTRTSHGSTLSKVAHCYIAHLLGGSAQSWDWYMEVLRSDIYDTQGGTTPEGIHTGVMGGSINIVMNGFAGIYLLRDQIKINPNLPKLWRSIKLRFRYKTHWISLFITKRHVEIYVFGQEGKEFRAPVKITGTWYNLLCGKQYIINYRKR